MSLTFFLMKSSSMIKDMPLSADDIVLTENRVNQSFIFSVYDQPPTQTFLGVSSRVPVPEEDCVTRQKNVCMGG